MCAKGCERFHRDRDNATDGCAHVDNDDPNNIPASHPRSYTKFARTRRRSLPLEQLAQFCRAILDIMTALKTTPRRRLGRDGARGINDAETRANVRSNTSLDNCGGVAGCDLIAQVIPRYQDAFWSEREREGAKRAAGINETVIRTPSRTNLHRSPVRATGSRVRMFL